MLFLRTDEEVGVSKKNTHKNNIKKNYWFVYGNIVVFLPQYFRVYKSFKVLYSNFLVHINNHNHLHFFTSFF